MVFQNYGTFSMALIAASIGFTTDALAQDNVPQGEVKEDEGLGDIIVTARRREESIQTVPVAVSVMGGRQLERISPANLTDLTGMVPNMQIANVGTGPGVASIFIRGLGYREAEKTQTPAVGVIIDGLFIGTNTGQLLDGFDIENVEVNRGPQSLFYGKNTTGGTINVRRQRPTGELDFKAELSYGNYNLVEGKTVVNLPSLLDGRLALKFGGTYRERDGYAHNLYTGKSEGDETTKAFNAMAKFEFSDTISALAVFDFIDYSGHATPLQLGNAATATAFGFPFPFTSAGYQEVFTDLLSNQSLEIYRGSVELSAKTDIGDLTSITGLWIQHDYALQDFDSSCATDLQNLGCNFPANPLFANPGNLTGQLNTSRDSNYDQFTQEIRLVSDLTSKLVLTTGAFFEANRISLFQGTNFQSLQTAKQNTLSFSGFAALELRVTDRLSVSGGARYLYENKDYASRIDFAPPGVRGATALASLVPPVFTDKKFTRVLKDIAVNFRATDDLSFYAKRAEGYRSGGFSIRGTLSERVPTEPNYTGPGGDDFLTFEPETVVSYEVGVKAAALDNRLRMSVALFSANLTNQQADTPVLTPNLIVNTNTYINNFQKTRYNGAEFEINIIPVTGLTLGGTFSYIDANLRQALVDARRLPVGPGSTPGTAAMGLIDLSGTPLRSVPKESFSVNAAYNTDLAFGGNLDINASWRWQAKSVIDYVGTFADIQPAYGVLKAGIKYTNGHYYVRFDADNILKAKYRDWSLAPVFFTSFGQPRVVRGTIGVKF